MKRICLLAFLILLSVSSLTYAQVGVGTTTPNISSALEVNATNKGVLLPSVNLTSSTMDLDGNPSTVQPSGMLVYNTSSTVKKGFCYWTGSEWRSIDNSSSAIGTVTTLNCNGIKSEPDKLVSGTPYVGTITVPYLGGNGGYYTAQSIGPINGLTASLQAGNFALGNGQLTYTVSGTPTISSPNTSVFTIALGGKSCSVAVGTNDGLSPGDLTFYHTSISASISSGKVGDVVSDLPTVGGKLRLDYLLNGTSAISPGAANVNPILFNISGTAQKIAFAAISTVDRFNAANYLLDNNSYVKLDNGLYSSYGYNDISTSTPRVAGAGAGNHHEVLTTDLIIDGKWYKIYFYMIVDNQNTTASTDDTREIYLSVQRLF